MGFSTVRRLCVGWELEVSVLMGFSTVRRLCVGWELEVLYLWASVQ